MSLATEISILETDLEQLKQENSVQRQHIEVMEFENDMLRKTLARAQYERDVYMRRAEAIKGLLDQTGALIVNSINKFHDSEMELQPVIPPKAVTSTLPEVRL
jgi:regulator of replication initiation timing